MGLGAGLNSFSLGATCATVISLTEWSLFHPIHSRTRLFRLVLTIGLLLGILAIEIRDQLAFGYRNFREAVFGGIAFVLICSGVGLVNYYWRQRRISQNAKAAKKRTQWSLAMMIYCMALVAVACSILNFAAAQDKVRWWWLGRFLLTQLVVIVSGTVCFSTWRSASFQSNQFAHSFCLRGLLVFTGTFVLVGASAAFTALLADRFLLLYCSLYDSNFCFWYTIGFISIFSILRYRTSHRFVSWRNVGSC